MPTCLSGQTRCPDPDINSCQDGFIFSLFLPAVLHQPLLLFFFPPFVSRSLTDRACFAGRCTAENIFCCGTTFWQWSIHLVSKVGGKNTTYFQIYATKNLVAFSGFILLKESKLSKNYAHSLSHTFPHFADTVYLLCLNPLGIQDYPAWS